MKGPCTYYLRLTSGSYPLAEIDGWHASHANQSYGGPALIRVAQSIIIGKKSTLLWFGAIMSNLLFDPISMIPTIQSLQKYLSCKIKKKSSFTFNQLDPYIYNLFLIKNLGISFNLYNYKFYSFDKSFLVHKSYI